MTKNNKRVSAGVLWILSGYILLIPLAIIGVIGGGLLVTLL
ncbi:MAG: hypothetical protein QG562_126 [Patescibacteria group bacterium]|nr:hypothetical protein [Patescibacteria group bacterium]